MELTRSDIEQLLKLVDSAPFDVIHIEWKGLKLLLKRGSGTAFDPPELTHLSPATEFNTQEPSVPPAPAYEVAPKPEPLPVAPATGPDP